MKYTSNFKALKSNIKTIVFILGVKTLKEFVWCEGDFQHLISIKICCRKLDAKKGGLNSGI